MHVTPQGATQDKVQRNTIGNSRQLVTHDKVKRKTAQHLGGGLGFWIYDLGFRIYSVGFGHLEGDKQSTCLLHIAFKNLERQRQHLPRCIVHTGGAGRAA